MNQFLATSFAAALLLGCGDDGGSSQADAANSSDAGITVSSFVGQWAAQSHVYTNNSNTTEEYSVLDNGGESRMTVLSGGGTRTFLTIGTLEDQWDAQLGVSGTTATFTPVETIRPVQVYEFTLVGEQLTLTNANEEFDFTQTGATPVPATLRIVHARP